jgi:hypothetical protein
LRIWSALVLNVSEMRASSAILTRSASSPATAVSTVTRISSAMTSICREVVSISSAPWRSVGLSMASARLVLASRKGSISVA